MGIYWLWICCVRCGGYSIFDGTSSQDAQNKSAADGWEQRRDGPHCYRCSREHCN